MKKILACLICVVFLIVGCESNPGVSHPVPGYAKPNIIEYRHTSDTGYFYVVDKNTNTVYMAADYPYLFGITVAVWPDGKPVTVEELERNFKR